MTTPLISFIVVAYENADTIEACLASIESQTSLPFEVVMVDNSPTCRTVDAFEQFCSGRGGKQFRLIRAETNLGFARGCNLGAEQTTGKYLFFLNPDTELINDASRAMLACLDRNPLTAGVGPLILGSDGEITTTCRNLPSVVRVILDAVGIDKWIGALRLTRFDHRQPRKVAQVIGAAMLIPRYAYQEAGGMDEQFFIYYEEVDLCKRLVDAGGEVWFWPTAQVRHVAGSSCEASPVRARMIRTLRESRRKYFYKHFGMCGGVAIDMVNRLEGLGKWIVLSTLSAFNGRASDLEKAKGFLSVFLSRAPQN